VRRPNGSATPTSRTVRSQREPRESPETAREEPERAEPIGSRRGSGGRPEAVVEEVVPKMDLNWATVVLLAQDESTLAFLRALYDQSAQLLTLSTATAAIFISLSDKGTFNKGWMVFGVVMLVISAICAVVMLTWLTKLMGVGESYDFSDLSKNGWPFSAQGLLGLHWLHWASLITLAAGVFFFILAKLVHGAPAETPEDTIEAKRIQLLDDQGKPTLIVSVSREEQKTSGPL
jgi:hypothetical protein